MKISTFVLGMILALPTFAQTARPVRTVDLRKVTTTRANVTTMTPARELVRGGDGTRGGGETVELNGRPELRDLVETSVCDWRTGDEMLAAMPHTERILKNIEKLDWYFALTLKAELRSLDYCLTGALVRVRTEDDDSLTAVVTEGTTQAAIRLVDSVYIDEVILNRMSNRSQGYLMLHEVMHSFLDWNETGRNHKLRSIVKAIEGMETGRLSTRRDLHLQMNRNSITFPLSVDQLNSGRSALEFALGSYETKVKILAASVNPASLFERVKHIPLDLVWPAHREIIQATTVASLVEQALFYDDPATLADLIRSPELEPAVLGLAYTLMTQSYSPRVSEWIVGQISLDQLVAMTLEGLANRSPELVDGRIVVQGQEMLSSGGNIDDLASTLIALPSSTEAIVKPEMVTYLQLLNKYLSEGDMTAATALTTGSSTFYSAFGIHALTAKLTALSGASSNEREIVQRNVKVMAIAFWNYAGNVVFKGQAAKNWTTLKKQINFDLLGYKF